MSVSSVNNQNNAGLYAGVAGTAIGAEAGAVTGYLTKPYLKNGIPSDTFLNKFEEHLSPADREGLKGVIHETENLMEPLCNEINNAKSVEQIKNIITNAYVELYKGEPLSALKENVILSSKIRGDKGSYVKAVQNANSFEEVMDIKNKKFDKKYAGKSLEEVKTLMIKGLKDSFRKVVYTCGFKLCWDAEKKEFVNCEEGIGKAFKQTARSMQGKYAAIYGAVGAALLGAAGYLCFGGNKESEQPVQDKVDVSA